MGNGKLSGGGGERDGKESFLYPNILFQRDKRDKSVSWYQTYLSDVIISAALIWTIFDLDGSIHTSGFS